MLDPPLTTFSDKIDFQHLLTIYEFFPYFVTAEHSTAPFCEFNPTTVLTGQYEFGSDSVAVVLVLLVLSRSNPIVKDPNFSFDP